MTIRSLPAAAVCIALAVGGCVKTQSRPVADTSACPPPSTRVHARTDLERLEELQKRADAFGECMEGHGFTADQDAIDEGVLRYEQIRNAERYGADPQMAIRIREQQLRLSPTYWRKASNG